MEHTLTAETCAMRISAALRREFCDYRHATKKLAFLVAADLRTAKNYLRGSHAPPAAKLIALMAESEEVAAEVNRMIREIREARR